MATWPLAFRFTRPIFGNGFLASVQIHGRLLAEVESEGVWLYGVNPGAIAASGRSLAEANRAMGVALSNVLADTAEDADTFDAFKREVIDFFHATDADETAWGEAVARIRAGEVSDLPADLPRLREPLVEITVTMKHTQDLRSTDNPDAVVNAALSAVA